MAAPDDWTGQQVRVGLALSGTTGSGTLGELTEVSERGIVLRYAVTEGERPVFYPWEHVLWVYPVEEPPRAQRSSRPAARSRRAKKPDDPAP